MANSETFQSSALLLQAADITKKTEALWYDFVQQHNITPHLHVIMVGQNSASDLYVQKKSQACTRVGIKSTIHKLKDSTSSEELHNLIETLNSDEDCDGILVQSPLPHPLEINRTCEQIDPTKDVDGFHSINRGKHLLGSDTMVPCTSLGITRLLDYYKIDLAHKKVAIFGRSHIVGMPTFVSLTHKDATVTLWHSRSPLDKFQAENYDVIVLATGQDLSFLSPLFLPHQIIVDVGIFKDQSTGKVLGDLRSSANKLNVKAITPVPGGIGPMTVNSLLFNTLTAYLKRRNLTTLANELINQTQSIKITTNSF